MLIRCCSISTLAKSYRDLADSMNWKGDIAGTRKTTPGFRIIEKYALLVGGCVTHRYVSVFYSPNSKDVSSMCMLKDNHIDVNGGITKAVKKAKLVCGFTTMIEVECRSEEDAVEACLAGAHIVMLDNFKPEDCKKSAENIKKQFPHITVEASGGINLKTLTAYLSPSIDVISFGALTQGVPSVDMSLKIQKK
jgi:nicotinate-nucleotide pyrophosphorylase (carboxylating)